MPPKGRSKKNGETRSEKGRKKAKLVESEETAKVSNGDPISNITDNNEIEDFTVASKKGKKVIEEISNHKILSDIAEDKVNGGVAEHLKESEEKTVAPAKRGRKKAGVQALLKHEEVEKDSNIASDAGEEPEEKVFAKRGRKKAVVETLPKQENASNAVEDQIVTSVAGQEPEEKVSAKRGRKKVVVETLSKQENGENTSDAVEDQIATLDAGEEPEEKVFVPAKRGRKKAVNQTLPKQKNEKNTFVTIQDQILTSDTVEELEEKVTAPVKRGRMKKVEVTHLNSFPNKKEKDDDAESDEDFVPKKTRGGRNIKESQKDGSKEEAPTARGGKKRKINEENAGGQQTKKGKIAKEGLEEKNSVTLVDENRHLRVELKRDLELEEIAKAELKQAQNGDLEVPEKTKESSGKGSTKLTSRGKRTNKDTADSKPSKVQKEASSKSKSGSKKEQIPDVTALDFSNTSVSPDGKPWNLKIASWNINGIRAWLEKNGMSYLHHEKPDVLCIQETKCSDDKLPEDVNVEGYHCHWLAGDKEGYSGVGLLSREKPLSVKNGIDIEEHDNEGRVITAEYEKFYLVTAYVPNAGRGLVRLAYRMQWDKDFREYLKKLDEQKPVILCGDLNVAHEEIDLANPKSNKKNAGFTKEEREGFSNLLSKDFVDTFRHLYPDQKAAYTFWTYMMNCRAKNVGWRLDYFVISKRFVNHLCDSVIRKDVFGSDHCPIGLFLHV